MRSTGLSPLLGLAFVLPALALASCTSNTTPVIYLDLDYQVRCLDCEPRGPDDPSREVHNVNGEDGFNLECSVTKSKDGVRRLTFLAEHLNPDKPSSNYSLKISQGNLDEDESENICEVKVVESANTYSGNASGEDPNPDDGAPCQVKFSEKDGVIEGSVYCIKIPNSANMSTTRYVVATGTRTDPASFKIYGCRGL